jgi:hypothetical protein
LGICLIFVFLDLLIPHFNSKKGNLMKMFQLFGSGFIVLALVWVVGCGNRQGNPPRGGNAADKKGDDEDDHNHGPGPHGGTIIEFGKWHGEFTVNHKTKEATVFILGADAKKPAPIPADGLLLSIKSPPFQVDLKATPEAGDPKGKSSRFVAKHEHFGKEQEFEGTLSGVIDGTHYAGDFKEKAEEPKQKKK